jgi:hypothetical protein
MWSLMAAVVLARTVYKDHMAKRLPGHQDFPHGVVERVRSISSDDQNVGPGPGTHDMPIDLLMIRIVIDVEVGNQSELHVRCSNLLPRD